MLTKKDEFYQAIAANNVPLILEMMTNNEIKALLADFAESDQLLTFACIDNNHIHLLPLLLNHITVTNYFAQHTLARAAAKGDYDVVKILLERGAAHYNFFVNGHETALFCACDNGHKDIVELFLSDPIPYTVFDISRRGFSFYHLLRSEHVHLAVKAACVNQFTTIIDTMKSIINFMHYDNYLELLSDIPTDMIDYLLTIRPLSNRIPFVIGLLPLIIELCKKDKPGVIAWIAEKYQVDLTTRQTQQKMLNTIGAHGSIFTLRFLMQEPFNIDINQPIGFYGDTILILACKGGYADMVTLLLEKGANSNLANAYKNTPLCQACSDGNVAIVDLLLASNCDVNYTIINGRNHIDLLAFCEPMKAVAILDRLVMAGWDFYQPSSLMHLAIEFKKTAIIQRLIELKASINHVDGEHGTTPLMKAIQIGDLKIIKLILEHPGIEYQITDHKDQTAAMMAESASPEINALFKEINETLSSSIICRF